MNDFTYISKYKHSCNGTVINLISKVVISQVIIGRSWLGAYHESRALIGFLFIDRWKRNYVIKKLCSRGLEEEILTGFDICFHDQSRCNEYLKKKFISKNVLKLNAWCHDTQHNDKQPNDTLDS
jgi:hypothetical protein